MPATELTFFVHEYYEVATYSGAGFVYDLYGSDIQGVADGYLEPLVYIAGVLQVGGYTIQKPAGTITFTGMPADEVTCTYVWQASASLTFDTNQYDWTETPNVEIEADVNGRRILSESENRVQPLTGSLGFPFIGTDFFSFLRHLYSMSGLTFDLVRATADSTSIIKTITDLVVIVPPTHSEIPGVINLFNVTMEVAQLST